MLNRRGSAIGMSLAIILVLACATTSWSGDRAHNNGFFLRLSAGAGAAGTELSHEGIDAEISGASGDVNFAIGGIVSPNLALHGTIYGWSMADPDLEIGSLSGEVDATITMSAIGVGLTYYVMPANIYFSGTVGGGRLVLDAPGSSFDGESDMGVAVDLTIGKEWWVGDSWGLGIAGTLGFHSVPDEFVDENWSGTNFGLRFSATLN